MPGYIALTLKHFKNILTRGTQHAPHAWTRSIYGNQPQLSPEPDSSPLLDPDGIHRLQEIFGVLLFYARAIDSTMLVALGTLESAQTKGTQAIVKAITQLLNYCATHHYAHIRFFASDMYLHVHSNASYQPESEARSRAGGYFFLSDKPPAHINENEPYSPPHKGALRVLLSIIKAVISSATEAELGALFFNAKDNASLCIILEEMVHPQ